MKYSIPQHDRSGEFDPLKMHKFSFTLYNFTLIITSHNYSNNYTQCKYHTSIAFGTIQ